MMRRKPSSGAGKSSQAGARTRAPIKSKWYNPKTWGERGRRRTAIRQLMKSSRIKRIFENEPEGIKEGIVKEVVNREAKEGSLDYEKLVESVRAYWKKYMEERQKRRPKSSI